MKKNVFLMFCLLKVSMAYCPVKHECLDVIWLFLSRNIQRPSADAWQIMNEEQKEDWWFLYKNNPTTLMDSEKNQRYIALLQNLEQRVLSARLNSCIATEDQRAELLRSVRQRQALAVLVASTFPF